MKYQFISSLSVAAILSITTLHAENWPSWRGDIAGSGISTESNLPVEWDAKSKKNIRWRIDLPERGNSTPVIWGNRIFLTQPVEEKDLRTLMCFDRTDGKLIWQRAVTYTAEERTHRANPYCSPSPAIDGERVFVSYGSAGIHCYDFEGSELWKRDFGAIDHVWGYSTSPVIYKDLVIHYHGPGKGAFLVALNRKTGETVWKYDEPDWKPKDRTDGFQGRDSEGVIGSFSTPIILNSGGRDELIMSLPMEIVAFNPLTGEKFWTCQGLNPLVYTSPVSGDNIVVAMGGYHGNSIAVKTGGSGDVTASDRLWHEIRHNGGIGSGVIKNGHLYYHNSSGVASCIELETGNSKWETRLPGAGKSWGSFLLADDHIYSLSQTGETVVFKADPDSGLAQVALNKLGEETNSSPAVSDGEIFIRTWEALWCIGK